MDRVRIAIAWVILCAWLASLVLAAVDRTYSPPATIHVLMMLVAGALFGPSITGRSK